MSARRFGGRSPPLWAFPARARGRGLAAVRIPVSHAFHSPLLAAAVPEFRAVLGGCEWSAPARQVASTVTGGLLSPSDDVRELLCRQLTTPVRFADAVAG